MLASVNTFSAASGDFAKAAAIFLPLLPTTPRKAKMTEICGNFFTFLSVPTPPKIENCQTKQVGFSFACPPRTACGFAKQEREFISVPLAWYNTDNFSKCQKWTQKNRKPFLDFLSWCAVLCSGGYSIICWLQFYKLKASSYPQHLNKTESKKNYCS